MLQHPDFLFPELENPNPEDIMKRKILRSNWALREMLQAKRKYQECTDFTFHCGAYNFPMPVHKVVLSVCSPYFDQVFEGAENDVVHTKFDPEVMRMLMDYVYVDGSAIIELKDLAQATALLEACHQFRIHGLFRHVCKRMQNLIKVEDFSKMAALELQYKNHPMMELYNTFVGLHWKEILLKDLYLMCDYEQFELLVVKWIKDRRSKCANKECLTPETSKDSDKYVNKECPRPGTSKHENSGISENLMLCKIDQWTNVNRDERVKHLGSLLVIMDDCYTVEVDCSDDKNPMVTEEDDDDRLLFRQKFQKMRMKGIYTDVVLVCDNEQFPAHKVILSCQSDYFQSMFEGTFQEARTGVANMNFEPTTMDVILNHFYLNQEFDIPQKPIEEASDLMAAADMFGATLLFWKTIVEIANYATPQDFPAILALTQVFEGHATRSLLGEFLRKHEDEVKNTKTYETMCEMEKRRKDEFFRKQQKWWSQNQSMHFSDPLMCSNAACKKVAVRMRMMPGCNIQESHSEYSKFMNEMRY